jgi:hypothetical protein
MARTKTTKKAEVKAVPAKPAKKKYLNNKDLLAEIAKSRAQDKMTNELAKMMMMLCHRYSQRGEYANYSYNDDMQSFALLTVVKVWKSFDPAKSQNPFAYFTQTIKHAFYQYLNQEKKQRDIRDELLITNGDNPSFGFLDRSEEGDDNYYDNDYYNKLIVSNPNDDSSEESF